MLDAKLRRTGVCGATETLLIDRAFPEFVGTIVRDLLEAGCEVRGDAGVQALDRREVPASGEDWDTEYLDAIVSARIVDGVAEAISHVAAHGSHHTDAIVTADEKVARRFLAEVDSAIVMWNASTQFRRRWRVRPGRRDQHRHWSPPRPRPGRAGGADDIQMDSDRNGSGARLT